MEQLWSAEALRAHWVLFPEELRLLKGMSPRRGLVVGYYLKFFQRYARFPELADPVPAAVADFERRPLTRPVVMLPRFPFFGSRLHFLR